MQKINELQTTLGNKLIELDQKSKSHFLTEMKYNLELHNEIFEYNSLRGQLGILGYAVKLHKEGRSDEEIQTEVARAKDSLMKKNGLYLKKLNDFKELNVNNEKYSNEQLSELDDLYQDIVYHYHPAVVLPLTPSEVIKFNTLKRLYFVNNYDAFKQALSQNPMQPFTLEGKDENLIIQKLENNIKVCDKEMADLSKFDSQFTKMAELNADEIGIGRNQMNLRQSIYQLKQELQKAKLEVKKIFEDRIMF